MDHLPLDQNKWDTLSGKITTSKIWRAGLL